MDEKQIQWLLTTLARIERHLNTIKTVAVLFLALWIIGILLQFLAALMSL